MEKRIVIDTSTGGLDYYPIEHGIEILRIKINIEGKEYEDGLTLKADKFYDMLKNDKELLPRTSQPSVGEVAELFQTLCFLFLFRLGKMITIRQFVQLCLLLVLNMK